jgi:hypothetical protein
MALSAAILAAINIHTLNRKRDLTMQEKYRKYMTWWFDEYCAGSEVDHYVEIFPELDSRLCKFGVGIYQWNMGGAGRQIDINNPDDVNKVHQILKVLDRTPGYYFFDSVFHELDIDTVCGIIGLSPLKSQKEEPFKFDYYVAEIKEFQDIRMEEYPLSSWSISVSEESFRSTTSNGNRFYLCYNDDWPDVEYTPGAGFPHDRFGYSIILVEVTPDNRISSVTSRWDFYETNPGHFLSSDELRRTIGDANFSKLFVNQRDEVE